MAEKASDAERGSPTDEQKTHDWRLEQSFHAGLSGELAEQFAASVGDLHRLVAMIGAGCPPETAAFILM